MSTQHSPSRGLAVGAVAVVLAGAGVVYWLKSDPSARTEAGVPAAAPPMAARLSVVEDATNPKPPAKNPASHTADRGFDSANANKSGDTAKGSSDHVMFGGTP